jgi:uncharacterized integral membrane protein
VSQVIVFLALAFSIVIALFAVQNSTSVVVTFLTFGPWSVAVSVLVLISAAFGAAAMLLLGVSREVNLRWRHRSVGQQLKVAQNRIAELEAAQTAASTALSTTATVPISRSTDAPSA